MKKEVDAQWRHLVLSAPEIWGALARAALARLGEERQILLFTCHSREARLAEGREGAAVLRLQS